jgi:hypothetical protein
MFLAKGCAANIYPGEKERWPAQQDVFGMVGLNRLMNWCELGIMGI